MQNKKDLNTSLVNRDSRQTAVVMPIRKHTRLQPSYDSSRYIHINIEL